VHAVNAESARLAAADAHIEKWRHWGPYVSERAWGTVREDYSADGDAWAYLPHDAARSRAYRWSEDGLAGFCDIAQNWCFSLALWNGRDPILKERAFGLSGAEGNHGEDVKEYWWYLDSTPTHSWMRWRYHYPQAAFPYADLVETNAQRSRDEPEYELVDTGVFADGFWAVTVDYAKAAPTDLAIAITVANSGPAEATHHLLPTLLYRNIWAWSPAPGGGPPRQLRLADGALQGEGKLRLRYDGTPEPLFCDNETNTQRLYGTAGRSAYPKDGIGDHVLSGAATVNPAGQGSKAALHYRLTVAAGGSASVTLRLTDGVAAPVTVQDTLRDREREADGYYAELLAGLGPDESRVARQAFAGLLWSKQYYGYDVDLWLRGDPAEPPPPVERRTGRNAGWRHLNNADVISMPDKWEYPWYAAWDLGFHCVALAHVDPTYAKEQLVLLCREWYMHPGGQLPAYEWNFGDVNPPVHAWAALRVFEIDGSRDTAFLERIFHKLLINFTWWVNRKDVEGNNVFEGGFLGLDNIGAFDRSALPPVAGHLEQSDGTAWMARFALDMLDIALRLSLHDVVYQDVATKFFEHFAYIATATREQGLWDEEDGFFYDVLRTDDGGRTPLRLRSMVGLLPLCAVVALDREHLDALPYFAGHLRWFLANKPEYADAVRFDASTERHLLSVVTSTQLGRVLARMLDEAEFLSPYGLRALSAWHREHPFVLSLGGTESRVDYEPAESRTAMFGGNSNWRGPIWFPLNVLLIESLRRYDGFLGADYTVAGRRLGAVADDLSRRLVSIFCEGPDGRRPVFGAVELFQTDTGWHDLIPFHEYFHGDTGAGLGAAHQTGWTALVAHLLLSRSA